MALPRQPLLFTETVPHNAYETVEGNISSLQILFNPMVQQIFQTKNLKMKPMSGLTLE